MLLVTAASFASLASIDLRHASMHACTTGFEAPSVHLRCAWQEDTSASIAAYSRFLFESFSSRSFASRSLNAIFASRACCLLTCRVSRALLLPPPNRTRSMAIICP